MVGSRRSKGETQEDLLRSIVAFSRRWIAAGLKGKGIHLADHEVDLLNAAGLGDILMSAAAAEQKSRAIERRSLRVSAQHDPLVEDQVQDIVRVDTARRAAERRGDNLLRISEVRLRTGLSVATIYRRGDAKTFPTRVRLGPKSVAWYESDIDAFVADPTGYRG